jgi:hypothetical protein
LANGVGTSPRSRPPSLAGTAGAAAPGSSARKGSNGGGCGPVVTSYGDSRRVAAAHRDLPRLIANGTRVGLVLLDDDQREQTMIEGELVRLGPDSVVFRHDDQDEEISLATIAKRIVGDDVVTY